MADSNGQGLETALESAGAVSVDLFGTLVTVDRPANTAASIADELQRREVAVPEDWETAFREPHLDVKQGAELPLADHVTAGLASRTEASPEHIRETVENAVRAAFTVDAQARPGAEALLKRCATRRPIGVLSNCSVPGLAEHALDSAGLDVSPVVTSVGCGWRKPDPRAFAAIADELGVDPEELLHVGDDRGTDGGVTDVGGTGLVVGDGELATWRERWD